MPGSHEATMLLDAVAGGDNAAVERLLPLVYAELRARPVRTAHGAPDHDASPAREKPADHSAGSGVE